MISRSINDDQLINGIYTVVSSLLGPRSGKTEARSAIAFSDRLSVRLSKSRLTELIGRRGLRRIAWTGHSNMDLEHGDDNEKSLRVNRRVPRASARVSVYVCPCNVCVPSFSELGRISSERETLLTNAEAHRTDRNPSIGLEYRVRVT